MRAVLSLGANQGDRLAALQGAIDALGDEATVLAVSRVYETEPVGGVEQPDFLNIIAIVDIDATPHQLLELAHDIESRWHRTRDVRWGPRTLDIDIVSCGDVVVNEPDLVLPHPRAHERAFVLVPWMDVEPTAHITGVGAIADAVEPTGVRVLDDVEVLIR